MRHHRLGLLLACTLAACSGTGDDTSDDDGVTTRDAGPARDGGVIDPRDGGVGPDASTNPPLASMRVRMGSREMLGRAQPVDLGMRFVGDREAATPFTIVNESPNPIELNATPVSIAGDSGEYRITNPASAMIGPGGTAEFSVEFAPTRAGRSEVVVRVHHADGAIGPSAFSLTGYGHPTGGTPLFFGGGGAYNRLRTANGEPGSWMAQSDRLDETLCDGLGPDHPRDLIRGVGYGDGTFVLAGGSCDGLLGMSRDGVTWNSQIRGAPYAAFYSDAAWLDGTFVAVGGLGGRAYSRDRAASWTEVGDYSKCHLRRVAAGNGRFVAVGNEFEAGCFSTSTDGETWTDIMSEGDRMEGVAFGNGVFVAIGPTRCSWSENGTSWLPCGANSQNAFRISFANGEFVVFGGNGISTSVDGATWRTVNGPWLESVTYGQGRYVAIGVGQRGYGTSLQALTLENTSGDAADWLFGYAYP